MKVNVVAVCLMLTLFSNFLSCLHLVASIADVGLDIVIKTFKSTNVAHHLSEHVPVATSLTFFAVFNLLIKSKVGKHLVLLNCFLDVHQFESLEVAALDSVFHIWNFDLSGASGS